MNMPAPDESVQEARDRLNREIGRGVAACMRWRDVKGNELAPMLGLSPSSLSDRLKGHTPFDAHELALAATVLDVPIGRFFDFENAQNPRCVNINPVVTYVGQRQLFDPDVRFEDLSIPRSLELVKS